MVKKRELGQRKKEIKVLILKRDTFVASYSLSQQATYVWHKNYFR
jgi:hypothetical protein